LRQDGVEVSRTSETLCQKEREANQGASAAALQTILQYQESQSDTAVCYFYFDFNDVEKQSSRKAIRSLLFQFAQQVFTGLQGLEQMYQKCGSGQQQPSEDTIHSLLQDMMDRIKSKYIILDALDECTDYEDLLRFVSDLVDSKRKGLRVIATSRPERDIVEQLRPIADYNINIQSAVVDEDIRVYVRDRLTTDSKLKKWPQSVQDEITSVMMEKANGMYAHVVCF
jgi:archaellum biogenesis ATPase FlaH